MVVFWGQEDSIYEVYVSEQEKKVILHMTYLDTNDKGQITDGVAWKEAKSPQKAFYEIYKKGKKIKTEEKTLQDFQTIFMKYLESGY